MTGKLSYGNVGQDLFTSISSNCKCGKPSGSPNQISCSVHICELLLCLLWSWERRSPNITCTSLRELRNWRMLQIWTVALSWCDDDHVLLLNCWCLVTIIQWNSGHSFFFHFFFAYGNIMQSYSLIHWPTFIQEVTESKQENSQVWAQKKKSQHIYCYYFKRRNYFLFFFVCLFSLFLPRTASTPIRLCSYAERCIQMCCFSC